MQDTKTYTQLQLDGYSLKYNWLTPTTTEYTPEAGWKFIEHDKHLDSELVKKVSENDYKNGMRYLKIRFLGDIDPFTYKRDKTKEYRYAKIIDSDIVNLDLSQKELNNGFRYIKVYAPRKRFRFGWVSYSEKNDGWEVIKRKHRNRKFHGKRKPYKKDKKNMMEEVKKYININHNGTTDSKETH